MDVATVQLARERSRSLAEALRDFTWRVSEEDLTIDLAGEFGEFIDPPLYGPHSWGDGWKFFIWRNHHVMAFRAAPHGVVWKTLVWSDLPGWFSDMLSP